MKELYKRIMFIYHRYIQSCNKNYSTLLNPHFFFIFGSLKQNLIKYIFFFFQMASLSNAMKSQKTHRERHQPEDRKSFGLLEKKKDYKLRAKDYNQKKETIKQLRKKTLNKNPDEFYFHMINSELKDGSHTEKTKEEVLTPEQIALMQTQDIKYVIHKRTIEKKKIDKLQATLHLLDFNPEEDNDDQSSKNTHTFFVDSESEKRNFNVAKRLNTHEALLGRTFNRPTLDSLKNKLFDLSSEQGEKLKEKAYRQLVKRIERERQLGIVQEKMEMKRHLQNKKDKPASLVQSETKESAPVFKWNTERKK